MTQVSPKQVARWVVGTKHVFVRSLLSFLADPQLISVFTASMVGLATISYRSRVKSMNWKAAHLDALKKDVPKIEVKKKGVAAVDAVFFKRLFYILRICVGTDPKTWLLIITQLGMLVGRSLLSLRIARKGGDGLKAVISKSFVQFGVVITDFFIMGIVASVINSSLKYLANLMTLEFRKKLTTHTHEKYLRDRSFYKAAILREGNLDHADQRITDDISKFCETASDLYSRTFKPLLDVILCTQRMAENIGYPGLVCLYSYFFLSGFVVRWISPPFSRMIAKIQELEGSFRRAHSRLITHAEEVAFLNGSECEKAILNERLGHVTDFSEYYFMWHFKQGIMDQYILKYLASIIGWPILAVPFLLKEGVDISEIAARYRESDSLIQGASGAISDLLMVYKKLAQLSGFTARVMELLEAVEPQERDLSLMSSKFLESDVEDMISFRDITITSPDGRLLVKDLSFDIVPGKNILVTGANGAGKTSLFRVLAQLWIPTAGTVTVPRGARDLAQPLLFYVPQRPYLASGSLRDQVTYPSRFGVPGPERDAVDAKVLECLDRVKLLKLYDSTKGGLDFSHFDWNDVLSGGEKQRVGLARLFFHQPKYAVLDEATSAINPDEEGGLYEWCQKLNITVFSIAHRYELKRFHQVHLHYLADGTGKVEITNL
ncbi:ABC family transporter: long-chain fatty acid [Polychytrium aggregatum]|uniref:ABC family transporter: long-chain fatty acid n=1 Tax=Polychytrium aggregatum TaxID=110093 RepID=UPI0022FE30C0|nr:ABC family transporter: long-chain fatty acid [Polychytrium aggregatum]KAI9209715.1 ABC family transporter: long-chain fatty acid [Polychytrium aggregatum]